MKKKSSSKMETVMLVVVLIVCLAAIGVSLAFYLGAIKIGRDGDKQEKYTNEFSALKNVEKTKQFPTERPWCYHKSFSKGSAQSLPMPKCNPKSQSAVGCPDPKPRMIDIPLSKKCNAGSYMYTGDNKEAKECREFLKDPKNFIETEMNTCCKGMVGRPITFQYDSPSMHFFVNKAPTTGGYV